MSKRATAAAAKLEPTPAVPSTPTPQRPAGLERPNREFGGLGVASRLPKEGHVVLRARFVKDILDPDGNMRQRLAAAGQPSGNPVTMRLVGSLLWIESRVSGKTVVVPITSVVDMEIAVAGAEQQPAVKKA
jgi:hypothetical protein